MPTTTTPAQPDEIRAARLDRGMSQAALAGLAKCSVAFVGNLEAGYIPKRSDVLPRILAVLHNDVETAGNGLHEQEVRDAAASNPTG